MDAPVALAERAVVVGGSLVGVVSEPAGDHAARPALVMLNSGLLHRVGMGRIYVNLARAAARQGHLCLRLDFSGVGDSPRAEGGGALPERWLDELSEAVDFLEAEWGARRFVILGNCSGAAVAVLAGARDRRIDGVVALNPQHGYTPLRYYLRTRLLEPLYWRKLVRDGVGVDAFKRARRNRQVQIGAYVFQLGRREWQALAEREARALVVLSQYDTRLDYFQREIGPIADRAIDAGRWRVEVIRGADHHFNVIRCQQELLRLICGWMSQPEPARRRE